jgi:hypothetical protein
MSLVPGNRVDPREAIEISTKDVLAALKARESALVREAENNVILRLVGELPAFPHHLRDRELRDIELLLGRLVKAKYDRLAALTQESDKS